MTRWLSLLMIGAAFLGGAFLAVLDPREVDWGFMAPVLLLGITGLVLNRRVQRLEMRSSTRLAGNMQTLSDSLDAISERLEELCTRADRLPVYEARFEIDRLFRADLDAFAQARESMIHVWGMQDYADVMSNFAAGERYINRVWSASTDGYVDEVLEYLEKARAQFEEGRRHFRELEQRNPAPVGGS